MSNIELLKKLTLNREKLAEAFESPAARGVRRSVVDKYSDQAHFIYELLQNADDAKATTVILMLDKEGLTFQHNGHIRFTVTDAETEHEDTENQRLGHINAITSVGNSTKVDSHAIGKFGVGFKAVFQYTNTPYIYDPEIAFRIERFVVPIAIKNDYKGAALTRFRFPFDNPDKPADIAFEDIASKLETLVFPTLFLKNLREISWRTPDKKGKYEKRSELLSEKNGIKAEFIKLRKEINHHVEKRQLYLFTQPAQATVHLTQHPCAVGFFLHNEEKIDYSTTYPAFCFFQTKEETRLNFLIQAPFQLTDSREGVKAGNEINTALVEQLAQLTAESLILLRDIGIEKRIKLLDDNIVRLVPTDPSVFSEVGNKDKMSFLPFYSVIFDKLKKEALLPIKNGFTSKANAYWASDIDLVELFSDKQLSNLLKNENAHWVFRSLGRKSTADNFPHITKYIDGGDENRRISSNLIQISIDPQKIFRMLTAEFIEKQSVEWLMQMYEYVFKGRMALLDILRKKPFILTSDNRALSPFKDEAGKEVLQVFLAQSGDPLSNLATVHPEFMKNERVVNFFKSFGLKFPDTAAEIYLQILPMYENGLIKYDADTMRNHFRLFLDFSETCTDSERSILAQKLSKIDFILAHSPNKPEDLDYIAPEQIYLPTAELAEYFCGSNVGYFLSKNHYQSIIESIGDARFDQFIRLLGIGNVPRIKHSNFGYNTDKLQEFGLDDLQISFKHLSDTQLIDVTMDGIEVFMRQPMTVKRSILLWNFLLKNIELIVEEARATYFIGMFQYTQKRCRYPNDWQIFSPTLQRILRETEWVFRDNGSRPQQPSELIFSELSIDLYNLDSDSAIFLLSYIGIQNKSIEDSDLTDGQNLIFEIQKLALAAGIPLEEILADIKRKMESQIKPIDVSEVTPILFQSNKEQANSDEIEHFDNQLKKIGKKIRDERNQQNEHSNDDSNDIGTGNRMSNGFGESPNDKNDTSQNETDTETDEFQPIQINIDRKSKILKEKAEAELAEWTLVEELKATAQQSEKYSFAWFKSLLQLEYLFSGESNTNSKSISIQFGNVARETGTERTLILKNPNRYIPQTIEDIGDISLRLSMKNGDTRSLTIEVVSVKEYTLRAKLKNQNDLEELDLTNISRATIDVKNPVFILEQLLKSFKNIEESADYNFRDQLTPNIRFIFGPPGTGKTTHLAREVLIPKMRETKDFKILVLTPTNKAADVLTKKIIEILTIEGDDTYDDWLIRFGITGDSDLENWGLLKDKKFDIRQFRRYIVVTTIQRFPYDGFQPEGQPYPLLLKKMDWDLIIFDEASMIQLASISYVLYTHMDKQFIVAGDPLQIPPISAIEEWQEENIYSMVKLDNFSTPTTVPYTYEVTKLMTQFRSTPSIGNIFNYFAYDGLLAHHRLQASRRPLVMSHFDVKSINTITFPVSNYYRIYQAQRLNGSAYHTYSAILTFEFIRHLTGQIIQNHPGEIWRIGIICPYRAQATLIDKLVASADNRTPEISVQTGTIHGFQGDECDIIIAVFNPPPTLSTSPRLFLNKQNILNVAISRAKNYLFLLVPDHRTLNVDKLYNLRIIRSLVGKFAEGDNAIWEAEDVERRIFKTPQYILDNAFTTTHQSVNVYARPEKLYEIRTEDTAIDVQLKN